MSRSDRPAPTPTLAAMQRRFFALISAPASARPADAGAAIDSMIVGDARASAAERLDVYAGMYFFRIRDVLREYFPKLAAVLGEEDFGDLAADYLQAHPSTHPSLRHVGRALPGFIVGHGAARERPWLAELAALEHARLDVHDRADVPLLAREALAAVPPEAFADLALRAVPAIELVPARHAVEQTWRSLEPPPAAPAGHTLLVWRHGVTVHHRPLEPDEADALALVRAGTAFGALCARLGERREPADAAQLAATFLARWLADELLAG
jgi:hypothetical protein